MAEYQEQLHAEEDMTPVEAPAGSCIIFHGNVWCETHSFAQASAGVV